MTHYSSIDLKDFDFVFSPRQPLAPPTVARVVLVGSLAQPYKGVDILLRSAAGCSAAGRAVEVVVVGDGKYRSELERLAVELGLQGRVTFTGNVPAGSAVRTVLDGADLFVLPSRTEGLPRAVIEAMARALPCIGSNVGGLPELLAAEDLVPSGDVAALTATLLEVLGDAARLAAMSSRNLEKAREFHHDALSAKRRAFYRHLRVTIETHGQHAPSVAREVTAGAPHAA
jgi:glycosyltransferase involved in cell wall biosynthesis